MTASAFESYLRHGRRFGVDDDFWEAAASELGRTQLRRLAVELGSKLPAKWANPRKGPLEAASQAGSTVDKSLTQPAGHRAAVDTAEGRKRNCSNCGRALGSMARTDLCRRCYQAAWVRDRRAQR